MSTAHKKTVSFGRAPSVQDRELLNTSHDPNRHDSEGALPSTGLFVVLEGPDGAGKTTHAANLVNWLSQRGVDVVACRDPGGTPLGDRLRQLLLDRNEIAIGLRAEMLVYMASRAQLVADVIRPALSDGKVVVCDRFLLSNVVYQGYAGGLDIDEIWHVGALATGGLAPDVTFLLDIAPEIARFRVGRPRDRIEDRPDAYRVKVREGFLELAKTYPAPIVLIDGSADLDTIATRLQAEVGRALALGPRT